MLSNSFKNLPCEVSPGGGALREPEPGTRRVVLAAGITVSFGEAGGGCGEAEPPHGSFGQDEGPVPPWAGAAVQAGTRLPYLHRAVGNGWGLTEGNRGPGPTGTMQHTFLQNQLLPLSLLS